MPRKLVISTVIFIFLICPACTQKRVWKSTPVSQALNSKSYDAGFEPLKKEADFLVFASYKSLNNFYILT